MSADKIKNTGELNGKEKTKSPNTMCNTKM